MNRQTFAWGHLKKQLHTRTPWVEYFYFTGLLLAALVIFIINLGNAPLQDGTESIVAQVAKEIWKSPQNLEDWLFPTLWEKNLLNRPPLIQNLIALSYRLGGINEWTTRVPGAILAACSVPLLYSVGKETFIIRTPALYSALIYLTWLPVLRQGRLALLDGPLLFFEILTIFSVLRSRRDLRWTLGIGIGFGAICSLGGISGLIVAAIALLFLAWDTPRLLSSLYMWCGICLGTTPIIAWYVAQWLHYEQVTGNAVSIALMQQSWQQFWQVSANELTQSSYYLGEIFIYSCPWLIFALHGLKLACENCNWSWAKLVSIWSLGYLVAIAPLLTQFPEFIVPIYPILSLAAGAKLKQVLDRPSYVAYPRVWSWLLTSLAGLVTAAAIYLGAAGAISFFSVVILGSIALNAVIAAVLIQRRDRIFLAVLFWGMYVSLVLFFCSADWVWQWERTFPVKPVATIIKRVVPQDRVVYTSFSYSSSLNFYSDRQVVPLEIPKLKQHWQASKNPYLLIDPQLIEQLNLKSESVKFLDTNESTSQNLVLITKQHKYDRQN
jgi:4-amino-4-deoxy-L-arabinose transferase-like glycosyltransferase